MLTDTPAPTVHITNYQLNINADYLTQAIADHMPHDATLPENMYVSIAYMQASKKAATFATALVLSIRGKTYRFTVVNKDERAYFVQVALDLANQLTPEGKDSFMREYQQAFEAVVNKNIKQIVKAIICAYGK